jgi:hypothetical protein
MHASASCPVSYQDPAIYQVGDVSQGAIRRTFGDRRPFAGGEVAFKPIKQAIEHLDLSLIHGKSGMTLPETRLGQYGVKRVLRLIKCALEGG